MLKKSKICLKEKSVISRSAAIRGGGGQAECRALMVFAQPDGQVRWEFKSFQEIFFPTKNAVGTMHLANFCSAWPPNQVGIFRQDFIFSAKNVSYHLWKKFTTHFLWRLAGKTWFLSSMAPVAQVRLQVSIFSMKMVFVKYHLVFPFSYLICSSL